MANDFSSFAACKALWRLESGALGTDSKSTNTLTPSANALSDATTNHYREGSSGLYLPRLASSYGNLSIADASLASGFPFKSGETNRLITVTCWVRPLTVSDTTSRYIFAKYQSAQRSFGLYLYSGAFYILVASAASTSATHYTSGSYASFNTWHFVALSIDGNNATRKIRLLVWKEATQRWDRYEYTPTAADVYISTAPFSIGATGDATPASPYFGWIDEVAVFNALLTENTIERIRAGTFSGSTDSYTNDFSTTSDCKALYRLESGALTADSKSTNTLTNSASPVTESTAWTLYSEGSCCGLFTRASSQSLSIVDSSLVSGFPLKSSESNMIQTICFWMRYASATSIGGLVSKYDAAGNKRCFSIHWTTTDCLRVYWGHTTGTAAETFTCGNSSVGTNQWYHVSVAMDGTNKRLLVYIYYGWGKYGTIYEFAPTNTMSLTTAPFCIGSNYNVDYWNGYIDEVVVFNKFLSIADMDAVRSGTFSGNLRKPVTFRSLFAQVAHRTVDNGNFRCLDPLIGVDVNPGISFAYPKRTSSGTTISPGEKLLIAKTPETTMSGTVTATNNSVSVTTTNDLTSSLAANYVIRIGGDDELHLISAITSNTITLYRPYNKTTGSGKSLTRIETIPSSPNEWVNNAMDGSSLVKASELRGGINTSSPSTADGFTVLLFDGATSSNLGVNSTSDFVKVTRIGSLYSSNPFQLSGKYCTGEDLFIGACTGSTGQFQGLLRSSTLSRVIFENSSYVIFTGATNCTFNDVVIQQAGTSQDVFTGTWIDCTFNRLKHVGNATGPRIISITASNSHWINVQFLDCLFGSLNTVAYIIRCYQAAYIPSYLNILFRNCRLNYASGLIYVNADNNSWIGQLRFEDYNQQSGIHKCFTNSGFSEAAADYSPQSVMQPDLNIYRTASPAIKIDLPKMEIDSPAIRPFELAYAAGTTTTISAYLMKNANYGSDYIPKMVVSHYTGTAPNITRVATEVSMSNVEGSWSQVSHTFVPATNTADLEFQFGSRNPSARAWISDLTVSTGSKSVSNPTSNQFLNDSSCVAWYRFEPGALTTDAMGKNTLTNVNCTSETSIIKEGSGSLKLDTVFDQYMALVSPSSDFPFHVNTPQIGTMCAWVRVSSLVPNLVHIFGQSDQPPTSDGISISIFSDGRIFVPFGRTTSESQTFDTKYSLTLNRWYHIALVVDGPNCIIHIRFYDSVTDTTTNVDIISDGPLYGYDSQFRIGAWANFDAYYDDTFDGYIDEVVIFNRFLEDAEIDRIRTFTYQF